MIRYLETQSKSNIYSKHWISNGMQSFSSSFFMSIYSHRLSRHSCEQQNVQQHLLQSGQHFLIRSKQKNIIVNSNDINKTGENKNNKLTSIPAGCLKSNIQ